MERRKGLFLDPWEPEFKAKYIVPIRVTKFMEKSQVLLDFIRANSHALSVRLTHFPHCLTQFLNILFLTHFWFSKKSFPDFPNFGKKKSLIFQFRNKYFPDFPIFGKKLPRFSEKKFPWFSDFQKKVSPISDFGKSRNRAKISNFASKFLSHTKRTS